MIESEDLPIKDKLPLSIPSAEYKYAYGRLQYFVIYPFDKTRLTLKKLSVETSTVGEDLALALRGGGSVIKEVMKSVTARGEWITYESWRWAAIGYLGREKISAELIPEENQIYILKSYTGDFDDGFVLKVPIKTSEYSILTADEECPSVAFFQDQEILSPSIKNERDINSLYARLLEEAVAGILKVLPHPL